MLLVSSRQQAACMPSALSSVHSGRSTAVINPLITHSLTRPLHKHSLSSASCSVSFTFLHRNYTSTSVLGHFGPRSFGPLLKTEMTEDRSDRGPKCPNTLRRLMFLLRDAVAKCIILSVSPLVCLSYLCTVLKWLTYQAFFLSRS